MYTFNGTILSTFVLMKTTMIIIITKDFFIRNIHDTVFVVKYHDKGGHTKLVKTKLFFSELIKIKLIIKTTKLIITKIIKLQTTKPIKNKLVK